MIRQVFGYLVLIIIVLLILWWVISGGPWRAWNAIKAAGSPAGAYFNAGGKDFHLPWQPDFSKAYLDTSSSTESSLNGEVSSNASTLDALQQRYADLSTRLENTKEFGQISPYAGQVIIAGSLVTSSDVNQENIQIQSSTDTPVSLAGWSLGSIISGIRIPLPRAASPLITGTDNALKSVILYAHGGAVIVSGASPAGASFRENACSYYMQKYLPIFPDLNPGNCPDPAAELPLTVDNLRIYGSACIDYVHSFSACDAADTVPTTISSACQAFIGNVFTYDGCVTRHHNDRGFNSGTWRLYLGAKEELWRNDHDVIRLLDAQSRTVDVLKY